MAHGQRELSHELVGPTFIGSAWANFWDDPLHLCSNHSETVFSDSKGFFVFASGTHNELNNGVCSFVTTVMYLEKSNGSLL